MQTAEPSLGARHPSTLTVLRTSIVHHGLRSVYTGLTASLLRQMTYSLVRLGAYEEMKALLSQDGTASSVDLIAAAAIAGGLGGIAGNPAGASLKYTTVICLNYSLWADIVLVRMTSDILRPPQRRFAYSNAITGLMSLIREEGLRGLARGLGPNTVRPITFVHFIPRLTHLLSDESRPNECTCCMSVFLPVTDIHCAIYKTGLPSWIVRPSFFPKQDANSTCSTDMIS